MIRRGVTSAEDRSVIFSRLQKAALMELTVSFFILILRLVIRLQELIQLLIVHSLNAAGSTRADSLKQDAVKQERTAFSAMTRIIQPDQNLD